jgi:two-component system cell cycle sensor histidine kinase/response regulator CckA
MNDGKKGSPVRTAPGPTPSSVTDDEAAAVDRLLLDRAVLENIPGRVIIVSRDQRVLYLNKTSTRQSTGELVGMTATSFLAEESRDEFERAFALAWSTGEPGVVDLRSHSGNWWETRLAPVKRDGAVAFMLCTLFDVTAKKRLEEQLSQAQKMEAIGQLTAGIAHNFNNLLAIILPNAQLCRAEAGRENDQRLVDIEQAGRRAGEMVRQLMLFAGRAGAATRAPVDLVAVAHRTADICRATFDRRIKVKVETAGNIPPARARESHVEQMLLNICINARDAIEEAPPPSPTITIGVEAAGEGMVRIRVTDNGPGMTEATRLRVFEPFFTTKGVGHGTGLGLASAYAIAKEHGGKIRCESKPGGGATFEVELPSADGEELGSTPATGPAVTGATSTVLVIDDEPLLRRVVRAILEQHGYRVLETADGIEGIEVFERQNATLGAVILDRSMPGIPGEEVHARLTAINPRVPVVLLSGLSSDSWKGSPPTLVLPKPADADALLKAIRRLVPLPGKVTPRP